MSKNIQTKTLIKLHTGHSSQLCSEKNKLFKKMFCSLPKMAELVNKPMLQNEPQATFW